MKILSVLGARPQFIKAAVVSRAIESYNYDRCGREIEEIIVHTGQHYDENMSDIFFKEMRIPIPDYYLGVGGVSNLQMVGSMLVKLENILEDEKPDVVLVYGDTNSTLAGALAGAMSFIPIAHVEAGLRSFNMQMAEEINRVLTDRISKWLFCPTETAVRNLEVELGLNGRTPSAELPQILNVGDVMYDAALFYKQIAVPSEPVNILIDELNGNYYLATVHRAENTDNCARLQNIMSALDIISETHPVVLPLHPRTRKFIDTYGISINNIRIIEPVGYFDMISLLDRCEKVFTDSGGIQKEAFFFNKSCIVLRDETEWVELIDNGLCMLAGADQDKIMDGVKFNATDRANYLIELFGDGNAGSKIIQILTADAVDIAAKDNCNISI